MAKVIVNPEDGLEAALRKFKKQVIKEGILDDLKKKEYYKSKSVKRREKSKEARRRLELGKN